MRIAITAIVVASESRGIFLEPYQKELCGACQQWGRCMSDVFRVGLPRVFRVPAIFWAMHDPYPVGTVVCFSVPSSFFTKMLALSFLSPLAGLLLLSGLLFSWHVSDGWSAIGGGAAAVLFFYATRHLTMTKAFEQYCRQLVTVDRVVQSG